MTALILTFGSLSAQTEFRPGYVIKSEGDTLFGELNYRDYIKMSKVCIFRQNKKAKNISFYPADIQAYRFIDGKYFVTKSINGEKVFLEYLIKGKLNMYHYRDSRTDHFYFEKDSVPLTELPYEDVMKKDSFGDLIPIKNNKYVGILNYYLKDAPGIQPKIENIKLLERNNLIMLAEYYHNAVCDGEKCIVYEKKIPTFKLNLELAGGVFLGALRRFNSQNFWVAYGERGYSKNSNMSGEIIARIFMPNISENVYLRTGICYSELNGYDNFYLWNFKSATLYFPFQFEYVYSIGFLQPKLAIGIDYFTSRYSSDQSLSTKLPYHIDPYTTDFLNIYSPKGAELLITVGANINITKTLGWSINYNFGGIQTLTTGLLIKL